jgi:cell division septation protein DedD
MVLGGRHLVGIFALLVVVLGLVFTLGYLLGRSQYENQPPVAASKEAPQNPGSNARGANAEPAATPAPAESTGRGEAPPANGDFYHSNEPAKTPERLEPAPSASAAAPPSAPPKSVALSANAKPPAPATEPSATPTPKIAPAGSALIPKGAITLQVAAVLRQGDALALAQALQEKKFPAIVTTPSTDKYYRVQVGPYPDAKSANAARHDLEKQGFKSIVRR